MIERGQRFNEGFAATYVQRALAADDNPAEAHTDDLQEPAVVQVELRMPDGFLRTFRLTVEQLDDESSASRQHYIETGQYLKPGEAIEVGT
jgi:hypothetical protein